MESQAVAPRETAAPIVEARSFDYVPPEERHGSLWSQTQLWFMVNSSFLTAATGALGVLAGLSLTWGIVAGVLGMVFGTFFMGFHASQGPQLGLPQMIQSRAQFGYLGVVVPRRSVVLTFIVFNVLDLKVLEDGTGGLYGTNGTVVHPVLRDAAGLAIFGHDRLHQVFRGSSLHVAVPASTSC